MDTQIVPVDPKDKAEILDLMARVIRTSVTQDADLQASYIKNVTQNLEWWEANPTLACHLKAVNQQKMVGVILVAPEHHRQGIGRALVMAAIEECKGKSEKQAIWLNAAPDAIPFYQALGFVPRPSDQAQPPGVEPMQLKF